MSYIKNLKMKNPMNFQKNFYLLLSGNKVNT